MQISLKLGIRNEIDLGREFVSRFQPFLAATGQLYKRVCRSVGWSVGLFHLAFLASNFDILAVYGRFGLCYGYYALVGLCYDISRAHGPITRFRGPLGPLK